MNAPTSMTDLRKAQATGNTQTALVAQQQQVNLPTAETASSAVAAKVKATVQARYEMAIYRQRDLDVVRQRMLKECQRPSFAEVAKYSRPQGKKRVGNDWVDNVIEGPGIRFAEMAIRCMTNLVIETMTIYDDREKRIVNVSVTDLEGNVPYAQDITIQKAVERSKVKDGDVVLRQRQNSYGSPVYLIEATDDDIMNKQNALISKAIRTLGLRLVPGDIIDECMDVVTATNKNRDAQDPDAAKRRLYDSFGKVGVTVEELKKYLGHTGETLNPKELQELRGIYSAINDGETTWRTVMDDRSEPEKPKTSDKADSTKKPEAATTKKEPDATTVVKEAAPATQTDAGAAEEPSVSETPSDMYTFFSDLIGEASTKDELKQIGQRIASHPWEKDTDRKLLEKKASMREQVLAGTAAKAKDRKPIE